ncbi:hypothetical protein BDV96DRAFT_588455 [Lophiotrema nucula]|uniref:Uncharacterized protein n=1 Tax=Lophiotrema nucula TaxID=690887 RepID=A0A6A5YKM9_9PLEO|nr:hypothetical protein BDV96DRAFT_588455 [Lophiotrema nucula]
MEIYYYMMAQYGTICAHGRYFREGQFIPSYLPSVCRTSTQVLSEAAQVFLRNTCISEHQDPYFVRILESFPHDTGFASVQHLFLNPF